MPGSARAMRRVRPLQLAAGVLMLTLPGSALGVAAPARRSAALRSGARRVAFGRPLAISGWLPGVAAGSAVSVQFAPANSKRFVTIDSAPVGARGRFALRVRLRESGLIRVLEPGVQQPGGSGSAAAGPVAVTVDARLRLRARTRELLGDAHAVISGRLMAARGHRTVVLSELRQRRWVRLASAQTGARGRFVLRVPRWARSGALRVRFAGDRLDGPASARAGWLWAFRTAVASWYEDGGQTACGFHATYGVANVSLPCGTRVTFSYRGRRVTATVDDRGPYVAGRTWDLNQNTAAALSFSGVATVYYSL
jgi:rare lipoprotein A